jgi:methylase of polypeptide subunit release factors
MQKKSTHLGAIYTPDIVSQLMVDWAVQNATDRVLDLGVGEGAFVFAAYERLIQLGANSEAAQKLVYGSEIDLDTYSSFHAIAASQNLHFPHIQQVDFFQYNPLSDAIKFDSVIGNPPYVRRYNIRDVETVRKIVLQNPELKSFDIHNLSDLYIYFILHSASRLKPGGRLCVITADSWLNVGYGKVLRKYLTTSFEIEQITIIDYPLFQNAEVKAVILQAYKQIPKMDHCVNFTQVIEPGSLTNGALGKGFRESGSYFRIEQCALDSEKPWGIYWKLGDLYHRITTDTRMTPVKNIADTQIGYQTLAKDFFIFDESKKDLVEPEFIKPIIHSPSQFTNTPVIDANANMKSYVFMCDLEKEELSNTRTLDYILQAENKTVSVRGKDRTVIGYQSKTRMQRSGRKNWYDLKTHISNRGGSCEILVPRFVFRDYLVLWNQAGYVTGEQFIEFRPKIGFSPKVFLAILNSTLTELMFRAHSQIYGGGTNNMSPGEFKQVPIIDPSLISAERRKQLENAYDTFISCDLDRTEIDRVMYEILDFDLRIIDEIHMNLNNIILSSTGNRGTD